MRPHSLHLLNHLQELTQTLGSLGGSRPVKIGSVQAISLNVRNGVPMVRPRVPCHFHNLHLGTWPSIS